MSDVAPRTARRLRIWYTVMAKASFVGLILNATEGKVLGCASGLICLGLSIYSINHWLRRESDLR